MHPESKRIIICCDGTWKDPEQGNITNVVKLSRSILPVDKKGSHQVVFYDRGVGSEKGTRASGGATGEGLDKNIRDGYRFLVHNYQKGDEIYLFGFSRGAYTVRSLAGLINNSGLLKKEHADLIPRAYEIYRSKSKPNSKAAERFRNDYSHLVNIAFLGVWDTVGALGIPLRIMKKINHKKYNFHDTSLSRIIKHARHAIAIDEKRRDFIPTHFVRRPGINQDIKQVWFAGVHSDVGGGVKRTGLSDITLNWMITQAKKYGLGFNQKYLNAHLSENALAEQDTSYKGFYRIKGKFIRPIGSLAPGLEDIHPSVIERLKNKASYRPPNLLEYLNEEI